MFDSLKEFLTKKNLINLLLLGIMILAVPLTIKLARQQQILRSQAAETKVEFLTKEFGGTDCVINRGNRQVAVCPSVAVKFTAPTGSEIRLQSRTASLPQDSWVSKVYAQEVVKSYPECGACGQDSNVLYRTKQMPDGSYNCDEVIENCGAEGKSCQVNQCVSNTSDQQPPSNNECSDYGQQNPDVCSNGGATLGHKYCEWKGDHFGWGNCSIEDCSNGGNPPDCNAPVPAGGQQQPPSNNSKKGQQCEGYAQACSGGEQWCVGGEWLNDEGTRCGWGTGKYTSRCVKYQGSNEEGCNTPGSPAAPAGGVDQCPSGQQTVNNLSPLGDKWLYVINDVINGEPKIVFNGTGECGYNYYEYKSTLSNGSYCATTKFGAWGEGTDHKAESQKQCKAKADEQQGKLPVPPCTSSDSAGGITQTQAECVIGKRADIIPFYKQNGWCTDKKEYYPGIVNNWKNINGTNEDKIITDCGVAKGETKCTNGTPGNITPDQADCVLKKRDDVRSFYKNNGWCDTSDNFRAIVNNWMGINNQADKDQVKSCFTASPGGTSGTCSATCCTNSGADNCTNNRDNVPANLRAFFDGCGGKGVILTGTNCSVSGAPTASPTSRPSTPPVVINKYRFAENPTDLANASWKDYASGGVVERYTISDTTPGQKFVFVQFQDSAGNITESKSGSIIYSGPDPAITGSACNINLDLRDGSLTFQVNGDNFGQRELSSSTLSADSSNLEIKEWTDKKVVARMANPPDTSAGKAYVVTLNRSDGVKATASCSVDTTQISLGAKLFCRTTSNFDQPNAKIVLIENSVGIGTSNPAGTFKAGNRSDEIDTITKEGVVTPKAKLQEGHEYIICVKATPTSLEECTDRFRAVSGNNIIRDFKIPVCDINQDGTINTLDVSMCKAQWGPAKTGSNKTCEFNRDNYTNSFEYGCCVHPDSFNKSSASEPQ